MNIAILGAFGLLGTRLCLFLEKKGHNVLRIGRSKIKPHNQLKKLISQKKIKIDVIINLVALTNVEKCEKKPLEAYHTNAFYLREFLCNFHSESTHIIHISTDHVYQGEGPHLEEEANPINTYALTKYISEKYAEEFNSTILRINYVGKSFLKDRLSLSDWIYKSLINKDPIVLFEDIIFNPLEVNDLCEFIHIVIFKRKKGTFNLGSNGSISKANFAIRFAEILKLDLSNVQIGKSSDLQSIAKRPLDMSMNVEKFIKEFEVSLPSIDNTIAKLCKSY